MENKETFKLTLDKKYIAGFDTYDENSNSFSVGFMYKPKQQFAIKKIRGFKRVVNIGWSYVVELCQ